MLRQLAPSHIAAGFVAVLVGFTSSVVIVLQAAAALGATDAEISSWLWALGIGMGVTSIGLSWYFKNPVITAWSTPGAALIATGVSGVTMAEAVGAFIVSSVLIVLSGMTGWFERVMDKIPRSLGAAMLAGVLLRFGMDVFVAMQSQLVLVLCMFVIYLLFKRLLPRYTIVVTLLAGIGLSAALGLLHFEQFTVDWAQPVLIKPQFSWEVIISVGIPLYIVTMTSQNVPGIAVMRASGYNTPISPLIGWTGMASLVLAPFGGYALNLAAITAAICMGKEAGEDEKSRYWAAISAGVFYLLVGLLGATVVALFAAFPRELVLAVAGLALIATIANSLQMAVQDEGQREPALITFLVTASGMTLFGIGAAFWGLVAGVIALLASQVLKQTS